VDKLEIEPRKQEMYLEWYEDWDCDAFSDKIGVNLSTGDYSHTRYRENNFTARTDNISDRNSTIQTLKAITRHLGGDSHEYQKARQTIDELVKLIEI